MATGRSMQRTKQVGEYLVAAELCRRGWTATTFTGNVPDYDIVAISREGEHVLVQVKTIRRGSWQFSDARKFLNIEQKGKQQIPGRVKPPEYDNLVYVFVLLKEYGRDRFFVLTERELHKLIAAHYRDYLRRLEGIRPRQPRSYHAGLRPDRLEPFENRWKTIDEALFKSQ